MTFPERLKEERKRLKLNQTQFAAAAGVTKQSVFAYEKGLRKPDSDFLEKAAALGADVGYIVSGQRGPVPLTPEETALLALYRAAPPALRKAALAALASGHPVQSGFTVNGNVTGSIVGQDMKIRIK